MSTITRRLPRTKNGRLTALNAAIQKKTNPGIHGNFLTAQTNGRLDTIAANYKKEYDDIALAGANLYTHTPQKNTAVADLRVFVSHFLQVFNLGVARGRYPAGHRSFYSLDANSDALPPLGTEAEILLTAQNIVDGDLQRINAGGAAMENPTAAEVASRLTTAGSLLTEQSIRKDALDAEQEALEVLFAEADNVIKKVWDEVETFFNEENDESRRDNAREWGVVYITIGGPTEITGKATTATNQPVQGLSALLVESDTETAGDENGDYKITTTIVGDAVLRFSAPGYVDQDRPITIAEGKAMVVNVVMVAV